jgi:hypothetical protein
MWNGFKIWYAATPLLVPGATGEHLGTFSELPDGGLVVINEHGKQLSVNPAGSYEERDPEDADPDRRGGRSWERVTVAADVNTFSVGSPIVYRIAFRAR